MWPATFPSGQGSDLAGTVVAVGAGVTRFRVGDPVMGWTWDRASHASFVTVPVTQLIRKPDALSWDVAGSLYVVACAAHAAVTAVAPTAGETVVVSAAAGGVGSMVVQYLRWLGVEVIGIASTANRQWLSEQGAAAIPYGPGLADRIRAAAPDGVDAFIDLFGPEYLDLAIELGVERGRIETIISFERAQELGVKAQGSESSSNVEVLKMMADLVAEGVIEVPLANRYPLEQVQAAFRQLEDRHTHGKIVLLP